MSAHADGCQVDLNTHAPVAGVFGSSAAVDPSPPSPPLHNPHATAPPTLTQPPRAVYGRENRLKVSRDEAAAAADEAVAAAAAAKAEAEFRRGRMLDRARRRRLGEGEVEDEGAEDKVEGREGQRRGAKRGRRDVEDEEGFDTEETAAAAAAAASQPERKQRRRGGDSAQRQQSQSKQPQAAAGEGPSDAPLEHINFWKEQEAKAAHPDKEVRLALCFPWCCAVVDVVDAITPPLQAKPPPVPQPTRHPTRPPLKPHPTRPPETAEGAPKGAQGARQPRHPDLRRALRRELQVWDDAGGSQGACIHWRGKLGACWRSDDAALALWSDHSQPIAVKSPPKTQQPWYAQPIAPRANGGHPTLQLPGGGGGLGSSGGGWYEQQRLVAVGAAAAHQPGQPVQLLPPGEGGGRKDRGGRHGSSSSSDSDTSSSSSSSDSGSSDSSDSGSSGRERRVRRRHDKSSSSRHKSGSSSGKKKRDKSKDKSKERRKGSKKEKRRGKSSSGVDAARSNVDLMNRLRAERVAREEGERRRATEVLTSGRCARMGDVFRDLGKTEFACACPTPQPCVLTQPALNQPPTPSQPPTSETLPKSTTTRLALLMLSGPGRPATPPPLAPTAADD